MNIFGKLFSCKNSINQKNEDIEKLKQDINIIKENHLYHIERDIETLKMDIKIINITLNDIKMSLEILKQKK